MKVRDVMSKNPVCCTPHDSAQSVARMMRDRNVGAVPVVADGQSRQLIGMITDRDFCCSIVADVAEISRPETVSYTHLTLPTICSV